MINWTKFCARMVIPAAVFVMLSGCGSTETTAEMSPTASESNTVSVDSILSEADSDTLIESADVSSAPSEVSSSSSKKESVRSKTPSVMTSSSQISDSHKTESSVSSKRLEDFLQSVSPINFDKYIYNSVSSVPFEFEASSDEAIYQFSNWEDFDAWIRASVSSFPDDWNCVMLQKDGYYYRPEWPDRAGATLEAIGFSTNGLIKLRYNIPGKGYLDVRYMLYHHSSYTDYEVHADHVSAYARWPLADGYYISTYWKLPIEYQLSMSSLSGLESDTCPEAAEYITGLLSETTWTRIPVI